MIDITPSRVLLSQSCLHFANESDGDMELLMRSIKNYLSRPQNTISICGSSGSDYIAHLALEQLRDAGFPKQTKIASYESAATEKLGAATISIGTTTHDLVLSRVSRLHFHTGDAEALTTKIPNTIPLNGQFTHGVCNVLESIGSHKTWKKTLQYLDLVAYIDRAESASRAPDYGDTLLKKANTLALYLMARFPKRIQGVYGAGYPFYLFHGGSGRRPIPPPASVREYFREQKRYFSAKTISGSDYDRLVDQPFTSATLASNLGLQSGRNEYDSHLFRLKGQQCPQAPTGRHSLRHFYEANCIDIAEQIWPCQYCIPLQLAELYPAQRLIKDTNMDCLGCRQTSLMVRNVLGAASDVDLVVVADENASCAIAEEIKRLILSEGDFHLFDTDLLRVIDSDDGPADIFVIEQPSFHAALERLMTKKWRGTTAPAYALWCPTVLFQARLDLCFPISFEEIAVTDPALDTLVARTRANFAGGADPADIVDALRKDSYWTEQLMRNATLVEGLVSRMQRWRDGESRNIQMR